MTRNNLPSHARLCCLVSVSALQFLIIVSPGDQVLAHYIDDSMLIEFGKQEITNTLDALEREMLVRCIQGCAISVKFPGVQ